MLNRTDVVQLIQDAATSFPHEECQTCECYLGYVTQLWMDADGNAKELLSTLQPERIHIHGCLGCDPCPPGDLFAEYIKENNQ